MRPNAPPALLKLRRTGYLLATLLLGGLLLPGRLSAAEAQDKPSPLVVDIDFPGGSASVDKIDQERRLIRISPSLHKNRGWVCWWYFKVSGLTPGETLTLDVGNGVWATPTRAAFSLDQKTWQQTVPGQRQKGRIVYRQKIDAETAWFSWGPPFVPADSLALVEEAASQSEWASRFNLAKTRGGRDTPALRIAQKSEGKPRRFGIWVQARQHAWESGSSWVCKGFLEWVTSDDPRATVLRERAEIVIVPIMDIDNVAIGAGGKNQSPHDHNRDWTDNPQWRSVAAAQHEILKLNEAGRFDLFIDLHNPGPGDKDPFYFVSPPEILSETAQHNLQRFVDISKQEMTGPLTYKGRTRASGINYDRKWKAISKNWVTTHTADHVVSVTLETAWNTPHSNTAGYQQLGRELGMAIEHYLRKSPRGEQ